MNDRMNKILYLIPAEGFGGAEKQAVIHIDHLPKFGMEITAITGPGNRILKHFQKRNIKVEHFKHIPGEYGRPFNPVSYLIYTVITAFEWILSVVSVYYTARKRSVGLLFACRVVGWTIAGLVSKMTGIPCIWRMGSCVHGKWRESGLKLLLKLFSPEMIISNCNAVSATISRITDSPIVEIPNGVERPISESAEMTDFRKKFDIEDDVPLIGLAARPSPEKGIYFLADVVEKVNEMGRRAHFCIAGDFGWRNSLEKHFVKNRQIRNVSFTGYLDDISGFYLNCQIVILTSRRHSIEGLPNALMEAMALKKPVIATDVGSISTFIEHGKTGILVDPEDPESFAKEIISLLNNPEKQIYLGVNAEKYIMKNHEAGNVVKSLSEVIKSVVTDMNYSGDIIQLKTAGVSG